MLKLKIFLNHLFKNHNIYNMPLFSTDKGNGWYCPHCNWKHWDCASCKLFDKDY